MNAWHSKDTRRTGALRGLVLAGSLLTLIVACQSGSGEEDLVPRPPRTEGRWTKAFLEPALLIAEEIRIEGPPALRSRLALPQAGVSLESVTKATDNGLLHVITVSGSEGLTIQAHLDRWQIVATKRLTVLERPNETDVRIVASGEAAWVPTAADATEAELRGPELSFRGELFQ